MFTGFLAFHFGFLDRHRAATPVLIGSLRAASVGRLFMRLAGLLAWAVDWGFLSRAQPRSFQSLDAAR